LTEDADWPDLCPSYPSAIQIEFTSGYDNDEYGYSIPEGLRQAVLVLAGHWYENRQTVVTGITATEVPQMVDYLLAPYKVCRWL
jgi:uncharacterized phiE125 gp8 family phage protein